MKRKMTLAVAAGLLSFVAGSACGQAPNQDDMIKRRDAKLAEDWITKAPWQLDYDAAREEAAKSGRLIFAYFTRSYAFCPPCKALEESALTKDEIVDFGKEYVLFLHVTSQVETDKYQDLLQEKGGAGFPYLVFMDSTGAVVAEHNGPRTIEGFRETGASAAKFMALKSKAETGTPAEKVEFFMAGLGIGYFGAKDIPSKLEELKAHMSDEQLAVVSAKLVGMEVEGAMNAIRSQEEMLATGKKFAEMAAAGKIPSNDEMYAPAFWGIQLEYAADSEDLKLAESVVAEFKKRFTDPQFARMITAVEDKLEQLRDSLSDEDGEDDDGEDDDGDGDGQNG